MKTLYLIRHAKSSWDNPAIADFERPLNKRGERDAPFMGEQLNANKIKPDEIISSPATRALTTARFIAEAVGFPIENIITDELIYDARIEELLEVVRFVDNSADVIFLVGHNPGLVSLANYVTKDSSIEMPTCAICGIEFKVRSWRKINKAGGVCRFYDYPKKHFHS